MFALQAILVFVIAAVVGLGSAWWAVDSDIGFERVHVGSWTAWPTAGAANADPHVRARHAAAGTLPLNIAEGLAFTARADSGGRPLEMGCDYRIAGRMPAAGWWTVSLYHEDGGGLIANPARRYGFESHEVVRSEDGTVEIVVSPSARPGNWLPSGDGDGRLLLMLRLYNTPLSVGGAVDAIEMPVIERGACR
jgi:hypothetical protein